MEKIGGNKVLKVCIRGPILPADQKQNPDNRKTQKICVS